MDPPDEVQKKMPSECSPSDTDYPRHKPILEEVFRII
jgi:hypothetical protein